MLMAGPAWAGSNPDAVFAIHTIASLSYLDCSSLSPGTCADIDNSLLADELAIHSGFGYVVLGCYNFTDMAAVEFALSGWPSGSPPSLQYCPTGALAIGDPWSSGVSIVFPGSIQPSEPGEMACFAYFQTNMYPVQGFWPFTVSYAPSNASSPPGNKIVDSAYATDMVQYEHGCTIGGIHSEEVPYGDCCIPRTWHVPGDAPTIQAGIDSASACDIVLVACGTYYEHDIVMKSGVTLLSENCGKGGAIIDAQQLGRVLTCEDMDNTTRIEGFTLINGLADLTPSSAPGNQGGGVFCELASPIIADCTISNCAAYAGGGLYCLEDSPALEDCVISNCTGAGGGGGLFLEDCEPTITNCSLIGNTGSSAGGGGLWCQSSSPVLTQCLFDGNSAGTHSGGACRILYEATPPPSLVQCTICNNSSDSEGSGLYLAVDASVDLDNCIIAFNVNGEAILCDGSSTATLACCDVYGNEGGDWVECIAGQEGTNGNFSEDPLFCDLRGGDYHLRYCSPCLDASGCGQIGAFGLGICGRVWDVPADAPTIQAGIDSASCGDTVFVACGTYYEHDIAMKSGIVLLSEDCGKGGAIIDAQRLGSVFYCEDLDSTTVIEGFTISHGYASGWPTISGGGLYCERSALTLRRCSLVRNRSWDYGGGVYCFDSDVTISFCTFEGDSSSNESGGGLAAFYSSPSVSDCEFSNCYASDEGGGVFLDDFSSPTLTNCMVSNCVAGGNAGMTAMLGSSPVLTDCSFIGNSAIASNGGIINCRASSYPAFLRCLFAGNSPGLYGHVVKSQNDGLPSFTECTFVDNLDFSLGQVVDVRTNSSASLENCIVAFNTSGSVVLCDGTSGVTIACCDVYGNTGGDWVDCIAGQEGANGNFSSDPLFCDQEGGDYTLADASPCAPANSPPGCGLIGVFDVACVYQSVDDGEETVSIPGAFFLGPAVPNPFNPVTEISYGIPAESGPSRVVMTVYSPLGRNVTTLVDTDQGSGTYRVTWDGTDHNGAAVASGVYFYRIAWNGKSETKRMVLLK
jgi:hypothetical protein